MRENLCKLPYITSIKTKKNSILFNKFPLFIGANSNSKSVKSKKFFLKKNKHKFLQLKSSKESFLKNQKIYLSRNYVHNTPPPEKKGWGNYLGEKQFQRIKNFLKNNIDLLEIGAGSLFFANRITKKYPKLNYTVVDPFLKNSKGKKNLKILNLFFPSSKLNSKKFDLIILFNCLEHILHVDNSVKSLNKLLKPKGIILLEVPEVSRQVKESDFNMFTFEHQNYFDRESLKILFSKYNLKMIKSKLFNDTIFSVFKKEETGNFNLKKSKPLDLRNFENKLYMIKDKINFCKKHDLKFGIHGATFGAYNILYLLNLHKDKNIKVFDSDKFKVGKFFGTANIKVKKTYSKEYSKLDFLFITASSYKKEILKEIKDKDLKFKKIISL